MAGIGRKRFRLGIYAALAAAVALAVTAVLLLRDSPQACACAIPPDDDATLVTAQDYVAALASGDDAGARSMLDDDDAGRPDTQRAATLSELAGPDTVWLVAGLHRPDGGYGRSPAERVVVGLTADGAWDALLIRTDTDYVPGRVGPELTIDEDIPDVARGGPTPIFGDLDVASAADDTLTLIAPGGEPEPMEALRSTDAWAYAGTALAPGRYLVVETVAVTSDDTHRWRVSGGWFEVAG